jgi:diguanylate cyclase (GGDEF)-like protein
MALPKQGIGAEGRIPPLSRQSNTVVFVSAVLFLVCDAAVLGISYRMAHQVEVDAVTINLAGRQRMLSQRMVKALLLADPAASADRRETASRELAEAVGLFDRTLAAFNEGRRVRGGDGREVFQARIAGAEGAALVRQTRALWTPYRDALLAVAHGTAEPARWQATVALAADTNLELLRLANALTSHVEAKSRHKTQRLRLLQLTAFGLALVNFLVMLRAIWHRVRGLSSRHEEMQRMVGLDPLTGLHNRRALFDHLGDALRRLAREEHGLVVGFIDLNGFKQVNDAHGHSVGDSVLVEVAQRLRHQLRYADFIARFGGDEFVIVLHDLQSIEDGGRALSGLRKVLDQPLSVQDRQCNVGFSVGAVYVDHTAVPLADLIETADRLMYRAKQQAGRYRVLLRHLHDADAPDGTGA